KGTRALFIGVVEYAQPVEPRLADELLQNFKVRGGFAGEADDEGCTQSDAGHRSAHLLQSLLENLSSRPALHPLQNVGRSVLQRHVEIFANVVVLRDRFEQLSRNSVRISVKEAQPAQALDACQRVQQGYQSIFKAQIFAIASRILPDQRDLLNAACHESPRLGNDRLEAPRAEFSPQIRDNAEAAGVVATLRDL